MIALYWTLSVMLALMGGFVVGSLTARRGLIRQVVEAEHRLLSAPIHDDIARKNPRLYGHELSSDLKPSRP